MKHYIVLSLAMLTLQGCSAFTPPKAKPVIEDQVSEHSGRTVGVLATTPERRVVLVKMPDHKFCAEPSADAADNISTALTAIAEASTTGKLSDAQLGFVQTLATSTKQLFVRSQGVQLYRDGTFVLCTAYLNGAINGPELIEKQQELLKAVVPLIAAEIPELHKIKIDTPLYRRSPKLATLPCARN